MWKIGKRLSSFYKYNHEKVLITCKDISALKDDKLTSYFGKQENLEKFFHSLPQKARSMQTSEIIEVSTVLAKFQPIAQVNPGFWQEISNELEKRNKDLELQDCAEIINVFTQVNADKQVIKKLFRVVCEELEEFEYAEFRALPLHQIEQLLANYSLKNLGSSVLYEILSETLMASKEFPGLAYQHLAKLAYYFSRAQLAKQKSAKFMKTTEEILWNAIHQGQLTEMEEITGVISYIIPGNIGSNDLRSLLEFTLFRFLADPKQQITITRLCQVLTSFTHYIISYRPLDHLLKQLVKDSLQSLTAKELIQIIWAYSRHNKADQEFTRLMVNRALEILPTSNLSFRHFTYFLNSIANTNLMSAEISKATSNYALKCIESQQIQDHYLIKALSLTTDEELLNAGIEELLGPKRLPPSHPTDLSRTLVLLSETPMLNTIETFSKFTGKIPESVVYMKPQQIARSVYSLAKSNLGEPKHYKLLENQILQSDLTKLQPVDLGVSCLSFGLIGMEKFCHKALSAVNDCFHKYQKREYEDYSDTDQDDYSSNKLILVNEQELEFTSEIPASAVVQMAWMAASLGVDDKNFWTEKLIQKLQRVLISGQEFSLNQWAWTAKSLREEEEFVTAVDKFHFALLQQVLSLITHFYEEHEREQTYEFVKNSKDFSEDIVKYLKNTGKDVRVDHGKVSIDGRRVFMYEHQHYGYKTNGFYKQLDADGLLTPIKLQKVIEDKRVKSLEIFKGQWIGLTSTEKAKKIEGLISL